MATTITIDISPKAEVTFEVNGVKGSACKDLTKALEEKLGSVSSVTDTAEAYEQPEVLNQEINA